MNAIAFCSDLSGLKLLNRGKVRDLYEVDESHLLMVATDRLSVFDVVLEQPIPGKGETLNTMSNFWFSMTSSLIENHLTSVSLSDVLSGAELDMVRKRSVIVRKVTPLPVEAIVRGYLIGSGWQDYQRNGAVCGIQLPGGLEQASVLPEPIFTPSTKAEEGAHDENIDFSTMTNRIGKETAERVREVSIALYQMAAAYAKKRGVIIADTKFEFGLDKNGELILIDELLTPDSSRFWPVERYTRGTSPPSYDKQYVRDHLAELGWNKKPPAPTLPEKIIEQTARKYQEAQQAIMG